MRAGWRGVEAVRGRVAGWGGGEETRGRVARRGGGTGKGSEVGGAAALRGGEFRNADRSIWEIIEEIIDSEDDKKRCLLFAARVSFSNEKSPSSAGCGVPDFAQYSVALFTESAKCYEQSRNEKFQNEGSARGSA